MLVNSNNLLLYPIIFTPEISHMSQFDYIKDIARYGLENDQENLMNAVNELIAYSKNTKKLNFAIWILSVFPILNNDEISSCLENSVFT